MPAESEYRTIAKTGYGEYEEKKSRFLGEALFTESAEEANAQLERIRKQHYDARHHCYARIIGTEPREEKASDDGEPSGTAGRPMLDCLRGSGCTNVLVVVTRYFGGTLLGTGGLVQAYTKAAEAALSDAGIVTISYCTTLEIIFDYPHTDRVLYHLRSAGIDIVDQVYTDKVALTVLLREKEEALLREQLTAQTNGNAKFTVLKKSYEGLS